MPGPMYPPAEPFHRRTESTSSRVEQQTFTTTRLETTSGLSPSLVIVSQNSCNMPSHPIKRQRTEGASRKLIPRKRAVSACQLCRARKTKCDNARPSCGSCLNVGVDCRYQNDHADFSSFDAATLAIIDRIDQVSNLVETQGRMFQNITTSWYSSFPPQSEYGGTVNGNSTSRQNHGGSQPRLDSTPSTMAYLGGNDEENENDLAVSVESLELATTCYGTCEDVLEWPIFECRHTRASIENLLFEPESRESASIRSDGAKNPGGIGGIQEENSPRLVETFLAQVHTKNPILQPKELRQMAKQISENGFKWDAESCLVLLACALACLASPFTMDRNKPYSEHTTESINALSNTPNYPTAEHYYIAARKRVALLDHSVITIQCHFLSGVYEMYSLRPIRAWTSFNTACMTLQLCLRSGYNLHHDQSSKTVQRRLFWSCLKSECELRMEIHIPSSGLAKINPSALFPTPPTGSPGPSIGIPLERSDSISTTSQPQLDLSQEQSWYYYLADIAVRRILNRLMNVFYKESSSTWLSLPIDRMIRIATELESQLTEWHSNLPAAVASPDQLGEHQEFDFDELSYYLHTRVYEVRERLYRPFLFVAISTPQPHHPPNPEFLPFVARCLDASVGYCLRGSLTHRHHGTWYHARQMFRMGLIILAAARSRVVEMPGEWRRALDVAIGGLKFWEPEARDLGRAREILLDLFREINAEGGVADGEYRR